MLAARHAPDSTMRDLEQELVATIARSHGGDGQPREGFLNLTQRMENEDEDQLDVDLTIFDFLMYKATSAAFEWQARADKYNSDLPNALITMTAEWRTFLSHRHKGQRLGRLIAFRSRLLQFVLLLTHRYHPTQTWTSENSLRELKQQNAARGTLWSDLYGSGKEHTSTTSNRILDAKALESLRQRRATNLRLSPSFKTDRLNDPDRPTLAHLLPVFVELTAARAGLEDEWQPSSDWSDLAGQFMLQAVIDQYIVNGYCHPETRTAIFAFGNPATVSHNERTGVEAMRILFCKDDNPAEERAEWTAVRHMYIKESNALADPEEAEGKHPYARFEERLLSFLQHLHDSAIKPDLIQVEEGRINVDGNELTRTESREMIERMRL